MINQDHLVSKTPTIKNNDQEVVPKSDEEWRK